MYTPSGDDEDNNNNSNNDNPSIQDQSNINV